MVSLLLPDRNSLGVRQGRKRRLDHKVGASLDQMINSPQHGTGSADIPHSFGQS